MLTTRCVDEKFSVGCKEASLIRHAIERMGNQDWIAIFGEDHFVDTEAFEKSLAQYDPNDPIAIGCTGCDTTQYPCPTKKLGFCGGCGYAISRGGLAKLAA